MDSFQQGFLHVAMQRPMAHPRCWGDRDVQKKGTYIWHDDGQSVPRQHDPLNDITTFRDLPSTSGRWGSASERFTIIPNLPCSEMYGSTSWEFRKLEAPKASTGP